MVRSWRRMDLRCIRVFGIVFIVAAVVVGLQTGVLTQTRWLHAIVKFVVWSAALGLVRVMTGRLITVVDGDAVFKVVENSAKLKVDVAIISVEKDHVNSRTWTRQTWARPKKTRSP